MVESVHGYGLSDWGATVMLEDKVVWLQDLTEERWAHVPNTKAFKCPHGVQVTHRDLYMYDDDEMRQHVKEQHEALAWTGALK